MGEPTTIDPCSRVHPSAELGRGVVIGPYCSVGAHAVIGDGTILKGHVAVGRNTKLGCNNTLYPHCAVGGDPQDLTWHGEETFLVLGDRNVIRESVTINRGTDKGDGFTRIGNDNLIMACAHVAHDCVIGDHVIMANNVLLAGHVCVQDRAVLNGAAAVHQFTTIGRLAYVGGLTRIVQDVPPYMLVEGHPSKVRKVNVVGLQRHGYSDDDIAALKEAFRTIFRSRRPRAEALAELEDRGDATPEVRELIHFLQQSERGRGGRGRNV